MSYRNAETWGEPTWSTWSPSNTRVALSPGSWEICASVDAIDDWPSNKGWKLASAVSPVQTVQVGIGPPRAVTLELEPANCLYGTVTLPEGHQSHDDYVRVHLVERQLGTRTDFESPGDRIQLTCQVDARGRYGFFRLPYSNWTAGVYFDWGSNCAAAEPVDVAGLTRIDLASFDLDGEGSVLVDAYSAAGVRITNHLSLGIAHRNSDDEASDYIYQPSRMVLEAGGSLRVVAMPASSNQDEKIKQKTELVLTARGAGFGTIEHPLVNLAGQTIQLTFAPSTELHVSLVGENAQRTIQTCYGYLAGKTKNQHGSYDEAAGAIVFRDLEPGAYELSVNSGGRYGDGWRNQQHYTGSVDVVAGANSIEIPMATRSDLVVNCGGIKAGTRAELLGVLGDRTQDLSKARGRNSASLKVDASGQIRFESMIAGTYRLTIGANEQIVVVPSPPIDFEGQIPSRYMFRLRDRDSALRLAGVRSGDVLVAIEGTEASKEAALKQFAALSAQTEGILRLTVGRFGRNEELVLDATTLKEGESFTALLEADL